MIFYFQCFSFLSDSNLSLFNRLSFIFSYIFFFDARCLFSLRLSFFSLIFVILDTPFFQESFLKICLSFSSFCHLQISFTFMTSFSWKNGYLYKHEHCYNMFFFQRLSFICSFIHSLFELIILLIFHAFIFSGLNLKICLS